MLLDMVGLVLFIQVTLSVPLKALELVVRTWEPDWKPMQFADQ